MSHIIESSAKYCNDCKTESKQSFYSRLADYIKNRINPKTVLDLGCADAVFVCELRKRGIAAYGVDNSKDLLRYAHRAVLPYCCVTSDLENMPTSFPKHYDLVTALDFLGGLDIESREKTIKAIQNKTENVIISVLPYRYNSNNKVIERSLSYFTKEFALKGYYRTSFDDFSEQFANTARLRKEELSIAQLVQNYEQLFNAQSEKTEKLKIASAGYLSELKKQKEELERLKKESIALDYETKRLSYALGVSEKQLFIQNKKLQKLTDDVNRFEVAYISVVASSFWKVTAPIRSFMDVFKSIFKTVTSKHYVSIAVNTIRANGLAKTAEGYKHHLLKEKASKIYLKNNLPTAKQLEEEKNIKFDKEVKISILVPLYNTPEEFLREMIQSVINQSYQNWELCLADGSDENHTEVGTIVSEYMQKDGRIVYKKLENNMGIAENTNECIKIATGDYVGLFDHDDLLHESALFEVVKVINEKNADFIYTDEASIEGEITNPKFINFKPDFSPDTLRSYNYICHLSVFSRALLDKVGYFSSDYDGSQDYDMILRLTEQAKCIVHIPRVLYYWRVHSASTANDIEAKPYCIDSAKRAIKAHVKRLGMNCEVDDSFIPTTYKVKYEIIGEPLVSIVIPNKDHITDLQKCILSIINKSTYRNFEIVIVENNSELDETFEYYNSISNMEKVKIAYYEGGFNYSLINNFALDYCNGELILLLNNDIEVITPDWLQEMIMFAQRKDVGAVGAKLLYSDDTIQHAGCILGINGVAGHAHKGFVKDWGGYAGRITLAQNMSAVTAACLMLRREVFQEVEGLDPTFAVAFNDIDFCLRIRQKGYLIVYTPYAEFYHYESKSRGYEDTEEKKKRFQKEVLTFQKRWKSILAEGDPYYNKNLTLKHEDFSIKL